MLISIVVFGILFFLMSLLFPSEIRISRAINIGGSKENVHEKIRDFRKWKQWNDAITGVQLTRPVYTDSSFSSDQVQVKLVSSSPDSIITSWHNKNITYGNFYILQITPDTTLVQWYFNVQAKFPWEKFSSMILDNQLGTPMEKALANLKKMVEDNQ